MKCPECDHDMNEGRCLYCGLVSEPDREGADSKGEGREDSPEAAVEAEAPDDEHITTDEKLAYKLKDLPDSMRLMVIQAMGKEGTMVADDDLLNLRIKEAFVHRDDKPDEDIFRDILEQPGSREKGGRSLITKVLIVALSAAVVVLMAWYMGLMR